MNQLEQIKQFSKIVVDTGDVNLLKNIPLLMRLLTPN